MKTSLQFQQRGVVLVVAMVIMALVALFSLSALRAADSNVQVAANVQSRQEGLDSAQVAIERIISTREFFQNPSAITAAPYSPLSIDVNNDGREDFSVTLQRPDCLRARAIPGLELDAASSRDRACMGSSSLSDSGNADAGVMSGSICSNTEWQLTATAQSPALNTQLTLSQGVAVRVRTTDADTWCR